MKLKNNQLLVGTGSVDITPPEDSPLAGFGARGPRQRRRS